MKKALLSLILCLSLLFTSTIIGVTGIPAHAAGISVNDVPGLIDGILQNEIKKTGSGTLQGWVNGTLTQGAGRTSDWFIFSVRQYNKDVKFSSYATALKRYVETNTDASAATQQRCALLFIAVDQNLDYVKKTANSTIGEMGMMSWIYGLHLLNNGYTSTKYSVNDVIGNLLDMRAKDGGWALTPNSEFGDVDITAMVLQALAPYYNSNNKVKAAINVALELLSKRQTASGDFKSYGVENAESTAQVITALSCLGINGLNDPRFKKNNNTLLDGLLKYQLPDKSFCHTLERNESSAAATVQALYSLISVWRMANSYGSLYIFSKPGTTPTKPTTTAKPAATTKPPTPVKPTDKAPSQSSTVSLPTDSGDGSNTSGTPVTDEAGEIVEASETSQDGTLQNATPQGESSKETEKHENLGSIKTSSGAYKKWVSLAIVLLALGICIVLILTGKGNWKNMLAVLAAAAILIGLVLITGPKTATTEPTTIPQASGGCVAIVIECKEAVEYIEANDVKGYESIVPQDGIMLKRSDIEIQDNETVLDVLKRVAKDEKIVLIAKDGYVSNIGGLVERSKDFGPESGWLYSVNDEFPSFGVSQYKLKDGDQIEFKFVTKKTDF